MATQKSVGEFLNPSLEILSSEMGESTGKNPSDEKRTEDQIALPPMVVVHRRIPIRGLVSRASLSRASNWAPWKCFSRME